MKKISLILLMLTVFFTACEKDKENVVIKYMIQSNDLSNLSAAAFVLDREEAANSFQTFQWTDVDYGFSASITYVVQFDKKSNNFKSPVDLVSVTHATSGSITVGDLNKLMLAAGMNPDEAVDMQFRVKATVNTHVNPIYSDIVEAKITPYATTFPPIYMCGGAVGGWNWNLYTYKDLRSTAPEVYETVARFLNNDIFRFFKQTDWGPTSWNFLYFTGTVSPLFELNTGDTDNNFKFVGTTGYYKITVNMKTKSVAMEAVDEPMMFMTGSGVGSGAWGWNPGEYVQMTWLSNGIFRATAGFINAGAFRFFAQTGWSTSYNYPYFNGGTVTNLLVNADDGDKNFKVVGATGDYVITVNIIDKIVTMETP